MRDQPLTFVRSKDAPRIEVPVEQVTVKGSNEAPLVFVRSSLWAGLRSSLRAA